MINKTETPTTTKSNIIKEKKHKKKEKRAKDTPKAADDNTVKVEHTPKAEGVKVEMDGSQPKQNSLPIVLNRSIDATATLDSTSVIPIQQHPNQIFHQIQIQQPQPQIHQTQQVIQQHTQGTSTSNQPITEHVWVSGHQVFYNTR